MFSNCNPFPHTNVTYYSFFCSILFIKCSKNCQVRSLLVAFSKSRLLSFVVWMLLSHCKACDLLVGHKTIEVARRLSNKWGTSKNFWVDFFTSLFVYNNLQWMWVMSLNRIACKVSVLVFWWKPTPQYYHSRLDDPPPSSSRFITLQQWIERWRKERINILY